MGVVGISRFGNLVVLSATIAISLALGGVSIFLQNWREGRDSSFLFGVAANSTGSLGFETRQYGLLRVVGNREQSWSSLANAACDRYKLYNNTAQLEVYAPMCATSSTPEVCTSGFASHLRTRCDAYNDLTIISWATLAVVILALTLGFGALSSVAFTSLVRWKRYIIAALCLSGVFSTGSALVWAAISSSHFNDLKNNATFPFPHLSLAYYFCVGSGSLALVAAAHLGLLAAGVTPEQERLVGEHGLADFVEKGQTAIQEEAAPLAPQQP